MMAPIPITTVMRDTRAPFAGRGRSLVVADLHAVAILHLVVASFQPQRALRARRRGAARVEQLLPRDRLGADEALRQVAVDLARRVDRTLALAQRPGAHLVGTDRE